MPRRCHRTGRSLQCDPTSLIFCCRYTCTDVFYGGLEEGCDYDFTEVRVERSSLRSERGRARVGGKGAASLTLGKMTNLTRRGSRPPSQPAKKEGTAAGRVVPRQCDANAASVLRAPTHAPRPFLVVASVPWSAAVAHTRARVVVVVVVAPPPRRDDPLSAQATGFLGYVWDEVLDDGICGFLSTVLDTCIDTSANAICADIVDKFADVEEELYDIDICGTDW